MCVGSADSCLDLTHPLGSAAKVPPRQRMLLAQREEPHHSQGGRGSQRCVRDALQAPHVPCQAEPSYLGQKPPQKIKIAVLLSAWHGEEGIHNFCSQCFMCEGGLTPARDVSAISAVSNGSWLCSLSPRSRAGLALPWQPGGVIASRVASTACVLASSLMAAPAVCGVAAHYQHDCVLCLGFSSEHTAPQGRMHVGSLRTSCLV